MCAYKMFRVKMDNSRLVINMVIVNIDVIVIGKETVMMMITVTESTV